MNRTFLTATVVLSTSSLLLVDSAIKGGVLLLLAALVAVLLRRDSAATRHLVWQVSIVGMLFVPVFSAVLPQWRVLPAWAVIPAAPDADDLAAVAPTMPASTFSPAASMPTSVASPPMSPGLVDLEVVQPTPFDRNQPVPELPVPELPVTQPVLLPVEKLSVPPPHQWSVLDALSILWLFGFSVLMLRLMAARLMLRSGEQRGKVIALSQTSTLNASTTEPSDEAMFDAFQEACQQLAVRRPVRLLVHSEQSIPVVWGIIRLRLLLPENARSWSAEQLKSVLLHELAHIKRRDAIAQLLAQVACALHWFNPLVWVASWRLHVERERACDDLVLANGVPPSAYAEHLLDVATRLSAAPWTQSCGLAMARKSSLEGRLVAVLNKRSNRRSVSASVALLALLLGFGVALPVAMLGPADGVLAAENAVVSTEDSAAAKGEAASGDKVPEDVKSENAMPADTTAAALLKRWQALEERKTPISESSVARLRSAIDKWVKQPPAKSDAAQVLALRDRNIDRAEHPTFEVAGWLSEIAAINRGPLQFAINGETRIGSTLSDERQATLKFGPIAENGLRAAWSRYPERDTYVVGDVVSSSVVIQNASDEAVEFTCPYSVDSLAEWQATSQNGRRIPLKQQSVRGSTPVFTWRLKPGESTEIGGRGVAIGAGPQRERLNNFPTTRVLLAEPGEEVTVRWNVRMPIELTTGDVSFTVQAVEDVPVWSTTRPGNWNLGDDVTMKVEQDLVHATDLASTATLTWPQDEDGGTPLHRIFLAGDAFTNREPWVLVWERGTTVLWVLTGQMQTSQEFPKKLATPARLRRIDFSNRERIIEWSSSRLPNLVPDAVRAKFLESFLPMETEAGTPKRPASRDQISRAEDERPVTALLNGTWKNVSGDPDIRLTFSGNGGDGTWASELLAGNNVERASEGLVVMQAHPQKNVVRLLRKGANPGDPPRGLAGWLKRGIGNTLLLDVYERAGYSKELTSHQIVLERGPTPSTTAVDGSKARVLPASTTAMRDLPPDYSPTKYGPKDWAGWFTNQVSYRGLKDGTYPSLAFKYLREYVTEELKGRSVAGDVEDAHAWLELTAAEKNWSADEFKAMVTRIATWDLTVVQRALPREEFASRCFPKSGQAVTPEELRGFNFGPEAENGLRVAWVLDPSQSEYAVGDSLKCRVVVHNSGDQPVQFLGGLDFQEGDWSIRDASGKAIPTKQPAHNNVWIKPRMFPYQRYRLEPGQIVELTGRGVGIGDGDHSAANTQIVIGQIIEARAGDAVRISVETTLGLAPLPENLSHPFQRRDEFPEEQTRDWFGLLRSGEVKFTVAAADPPPAAATTAAVAAASEVARDEPEADTVAEPADELKPEGEEELALFRVWQSNARTDGKIPGAWVGQLGEWVKYFIELNDGAGEGGELSAKFKALLPRFDATRDWTQADAVALLNDVGAVHRIPSSNALEAAAERVILPSDPLPPELKNVTWGKADASGLRVAWYLQHEDDRQKQQFEPHKRPGIWMLVPSPRTYQLGSVFKSRILVHNSGKQPVFFVMPSWQQSAAHAAHDDSGKEIEVSAVEWTTMAQMRMYRLAPGAYLETRAPGIGVGARTDREDWASLRPGAWIHANEGDEVLFTPGNVEVRMSPFQVGTRHMNGFQKPKNSAELWDSIVAERVSREMPIPTAAADREQLLRRVVRDLYGVDPTQSEIDAFVADMSPGALHPVTGETLLRARVTHNRTMSAFTGTLPPGRMTFRVLAADPQAGNRTRMATEAGYYILGDNQRLHVEQSRRGEWRVNKATIRFFSSNPKTAPAAEPVVIPLPDGVNTYEILWDRGAGVLWVTQAGLTRRYDFTDPGNVKETRIEPGSSPDVPGFRDWAKDLPAVPNVPDEATPEGPEPTAGMKLEPGMEANLKWGATVNGLRSAICFRRPGDDVNDLYVVVQNVSDAAIRLDGAAAANKNTVWIRRTGAIQTALSGKDARPVDVMLQPREVAFVRVLSPEVTGPDGRTFAAMIAESALKDPNWTMTVELTVAQAAAGAWVGSLVTADTSGDEASRTTVDPPAKPVEKPDATQSQRGVKLEPGRADTLQWGEPVNGLRAALIRPPALGQPESRQTKDFQMVIQNVSEAAVRFVADATAPNPRRLTLMSRKFGWVQSQTRVEEPSDVDVLLQPGEVAVLDMLSQKGPLGSSISRNLDTVFFGEMTIGKAPPGAWTGTLATAEMQAAFAAHGLLPKHKDARALFIIWNQGIRWDRTFPGGLIGLLAESVKTFADNNPTWKTTPQLLNVVPRLDASRDWEPRDVLALLDEVAAIQASPIQAMLEREMQTTMQRGNPLPQELVNAPWGEAHSSGLRVAWLLDPAATSYPLGTSLKSRILFHNSGKKAVVFRTRNWRQSGQHKAQDAGGADIRISSTSWTTRALLVPFLLYPGEFIEVPAVGIGVGARGDRASWKGAGVGSWVEANAGDVVTFTPDAVSARGNNTPSVLIGEDSWWHGFITARLAREKPLPMDDEVRRRLVYHVGLDLGTSHSDEITNDFLADRSPDALDTLARRLAEQSAPVPFAGTLKSGPTTFRVTAAGADVAKQGPPDRKAVTDDVPAAAEPATDEVATDEVATDEVATDEVATDEVATDEVATDEVATDEVATEEPAGAEATEEESTEEELADKPEGSRKGPVRSANRSGVFTLTKGRKLYVCRPSVVNPWLSVLWAKSETWPESRIRIYPRVSEQNRRNWAVVWEPDADELWLVDDTAVTHVDITNPAEVLTTRQDFDKPAVLIFKFPERVREEFRRLGFEIPRSKQSEDNHVTDGQEMLTGETMKTWTIEGTVTGADGKPMADVPIRLRTQYHPTIDVVTGKTDAKGNYRLSFRLDLRTVARYRGLLVEPVLDGFTERDAGNAGLFDALLTHGEVPRRTIVRDYPPMWLTGLSVGENAAGPITRFSKRELVLNETGRADFGMLPASTITGEIVDPDGEPLASRYISVAAPDTVRPRGYETVASAQSDKNGQFTLTNIPANELLNFTSSSPGRNWEVSKSASQIFGPAANYRIRIVTGPDGKGDWLNIERVTERDE